MNELENLPKVEIKVDLTDVTKEAYNDGGKPFVKELGKTGQIVLGFINNTLGLPAQFYNIWATDKVQAFKNKIENKIEDIPEDKLIEPPMDIIAKSIDGLRYIPDKEELKEMFANLMVNSCNSDYSEKTHPRFVEIIKELSTTDAIIIKSLTYDGLLASYPIAKIILKNRNGQKELFTHYFDNNFDLKFEIISESISNLITLGLITVTYSEFLTNNALYEKLYHTSFYNDYLEFSKSQQEYTLELEKGILKLSPFGRIFVEMCAK